jgi:predicted 3-demethylubiquinone-9 3-methyltransferase (glyoxalase superfamily)
MTVAFELDGPSFTVLNGRPVFVFNEAISLQVICAASAAATPRSSTGIPGDDGG